MKARKKRLKTVYKKIGELTDVFASQSQEKGEYSYTSGGGWFQKSAKGERRVAAFFEGDRLYSYGSHYLLAKIGLEINGVKFSVVNLTKYSQTTTGQSYCARSSLTGQGHFVIEISSDSGRCSINSNTTDSQLLKIAIDSIKKKADALTESIFSKQFTRSTWENTSYLKSEVKKHNELAMKLKLKDLIVEVPDTVYQEVDKAVAFNKIRRADIDSRVQISLFKYSY